MSVAIDQSHSQFSTNLRQLNEDLHRWVENKAFLALAERGILPPQYQASPERLNSYDQRISSEMRGIISPGNLKRYDRELKRALYSLAPNLYSDMVNIQPSSQFSGTSTFVQ